MSSNMKHLERKFNILSYCVKESTEAYSCQIKEKILCRYNDIYGVITTSDGYRYNDFLSRYNDFLSRYNDILSRYND